MPGIISPELFSGAKPGARPVGDVAVELRLGGVHIYPLVLTALLPLRLFTSTDVCKHTAHCCTWLRYEVSPLLHPAVYLLEVFLFCFVLLFFFLNKGEQ